MRVLYLIFQTINLLTLKNEIKILTIKILKLKLKNPFWQKLITSRLKILTSIFYMKQIIL